MNTKNPKVELNYLSCQTGAVIVKAKSECQSVCVSTNHRAVKWEMKCEMWNVNCKRQKASVLKSQTKCQTAWCQQEEVDFKNAHFDFSLSLAGWTTFSLSNLFPLCKQCAKVGMISWCHQMRCIDQRGSHTPEADWTTFLTTLNGIRS